MAPFYVPTAYTLLLTLQFLTISICIAYIAVWPTPFPPMIQFGLGEYDPWVLARAIRQVRARYTQYGMIIGVIAIQVFTFLVVTDTLCGTYYTLQSFLLLVLLTLKIRRG
jgi:hypothetical protein